MDSEDSSPDEKRRPPYAVAYSVDGELYELMLPGDAGITAEDSVLKVAHDGPVLGIVRVMPVRTKGSDSVADADDR